MNTLETLQSKRLYEIDVAKCIAVFFMIQVHLFELLVYSESNLLTYRMIDTVLGGPLAAPVFMFCMGIGLTLTTHTAPAQLGRRGLRLLVIGYVLNVARNLIPFGVGWLFSGDPMFLDEIIRCCFSDDILQFAGLAFLVFALFKRFRVPDWGIALCAVACSLAGGILVSFSTGNVILDRAADFLFHSTETSFFPLLNWISIPVAGYLFGKLISSDEARERLYRSASLPCAIAAIVYLALAWAFGYGLFKDDVYYYGQSLDLSAASILLCVGVLGLCYRLSKVFSPKALAFFSLMGKNLNRIYCISWVIICWLFVLNYFFPFAHGTWMAVVLTFPVTALSLALARVPRPLRRGKREDESGGSPRYISGR